MRRRAFLIACASFPLGFREDSAWAADPCECPNESSNALVTEQKIAKFSPKARLDLVKAIVNGWTEAVAAEIVTPLRVQHLMAQLATETGGFLSIVENLNYNSSRMMQIWPNRFTNDSFAPTYAHNPQKLAEFVYGGRLGNDTPGDGYRYRGSGFIQLTGKANFRSRTASMNLNPDAVQFPDQIRMPTSGFSTAVKFWEAVDGNKYADRDDIVGLRAKINGGKIGLADAKIWLARGRRLFKAGVATPEEADTVDVAELAAVQDVLTELGLVQPGPDEASNQLQVVDALHQVRELSGAPQLNLQGVPASEGVKILYDEEGLYAVTSPDNRKTEERDNL